MKISEQWLREWANPKIDSKTLSNQLTMLGLEVDSVSPVAPAFSGVVVGEVLEKNQHPNADKLSVCTVNVGGSENLTIVCGAQNVRAGIKVPVAIIGAILPGDFKIKAAKLRGQDSQGMICSEKELGLADESNGIMILPIDAPVGKDFREYFNLNDNIIEIELTPNRGDCLSALGVSREIAAINSVDWNFPKIEIPTASETQKIQIKIEAPELCPKYFGCVIENINKEACTPLWMQETLRRSGIRAIHPVVDVGNYVMLEFGQPMHAFDLQKLKGDVVVRLAKTGENIRLLNQEKIELNSQTLIIADQEKPQALAGIMGGLDSSVTENTTSIFLECAYFDPVCVRRGAKAYHLSTDGGHRFERGVDYQLQKKALQRAVQLLLKIVGGKAGAFIEAIHEAHLPKLKIISLRRSQIKRILGIEISDERVDAIFSALGFEFEKKADSWGVKVPSHRFDLEIEVDLIEEIARVFGYDQIDVIPARPTLTPFKKSETSIPKDRIEKYFLDRGYDEVITYSFVDPKWQELLDPDIEAAVLKNPLSSEMSVMRTGLSLGLIKTLQYNLHRQLNRLRIFEIGLIFQKQGETWLQKPMLGFLATGPVYAQQWGLPRKNTDFYDIKNDVMGLFRMLKCENSIEFRAGTYSAFHPGQSADIYRDQRKIGHFGALHPKIVEEMDLAITPWLCEMDLEAANHASLPTYQSFSKFPAVRRDLAFLVDQSLAAQDILRTVRESGGEWLQELQLFDLYQGANIPEDKKSVAIGLTFVHPSRTLVEEEINQIIQRVLSTLERSYNATLRA